MTIAVKICGIKDDNALEAAIDYGAKYVGFVFIPASRRLITTSKAAALANKLPLNVQAVGLFINPTNDELLNVTKQVPLKVIQLHGHETPERVTEIRTLTGLKVMKAIHIAAEEDFAKVPAYEAVADMLLFDTKLPCVIPAEAGIQQRASASCMTQMSRGHATLDPRFHGDDNIGNCCNSPLGGTGKSFDWSLLKGKTFAKPWMLAGGLNIDNIAEAVKATGAQIIDLSSGVEDASGRKVPVKIRLLLEKASKL